MLTDRQNATVGAVAGVIDITCIQWAYYLKNARQQGLPISWDPRVLYRGYTANCANVAAGTCFQFALNGMLEGALRGSEARSLTPSEQVASGFAAGFASGLVASPTELVMTQQQVKGGSIGTNVARVAAGGPSNCLRGLSATCFREGIFAAAYLGLAPMLRARLREAMPGTNEEALRVPAALGGAAICGLLSHPFDTVKTCMQGDIERSVYGTTRQTVSAIWAKGGAAAMYRGIEFRFLRQAWQVWVLDLLRERLSPVLFPQTAGRLAWSAGLPEKLSEGAPAVAGAGAAC